jgi:hypothetical protein
LNLKNKLKIDHYPTQGYFKNPMQIFMYTKPIIIVILLLVFSGASGQPAFSARKLTAIENRQLLAKIKSKGTLYESWTWMDSLGKNVLVLFQVKEYPMTGANNDERSAELNASHFLVKDTGFALLWKMVDNIPGCELDITCEFFKNNVSITDLNKNGVAETTLLYKLSCKSDVSPDAMKLIMHEGTIKYALRGLMCDPGNGENQENCAKGELNLAKLPKLKDEWDQLLQTFGRYETEKDFEKASPSLLSFARSQWLRFVKQF